MTLKALEEESLEQSKQPERFNRILEQTVEAMEEAGIRYMFIGGIASGGLGRPRSTHDIDLFVLPEEAEIALNALAARGFQTERTDPSWLFKGSKDGILVDIVFKSKGEIYLDQEMYQRMTTAEFHGKRLRIVAPEDLLIIKAVAHSELTPGHWHDAIALLSHADLDWKYLIKRARKAPRRILSLLLYAQSNDIWVPNYVIHEIYSVIFENERHDQRTEFLASKARVHKGPRAVVPTTISQGARLAYLAGHLRERLAEDPRTNELNVRVAQHGNRVVLKGEVPTRDRRDAIDQIAREVCGDRGVENHIHIVSMDRSVGLEDVR